MRVSGSIATAPGDPALTEGRRTPADERVLPAEGRLERALARVDPALIGAGLFVIALAVYVLSNPERQNFYNHFVWQADAFLNGRVTIPYPVDGAVSNSYFQDVLPAPPIGPYGLTNPIIPEGQALLPFPPLPAIVLLPFVALWGMSTNSALICAVIGAINVSLCWRMLQRVTTRRDAALLGTVFYGFGTVAWYAAMLGSTWFFAHVVASTFLFLGITAALDAERREQLAAAAVAVRSRSGAAWRQFAAGVLYGTAAVARLTTIFGAPFFVFVGGGGTWLRRAVFAGAGAVIPVALLLGYNVATTGHLFHPAYDYLRTTETHPVPAFYHQSWAIEDPRYIVVNAPILLLWPPKTPVTSPDCEGDYAPTGLGLIFDRDCAVLEPDPVGMSIFLTSPAYLLAVALAAASWRRRLVCGAALATIAIAIVNLMHFSQGWVQFGYRFSNDFAPFAVILVALAVERWRSNALTVGLIAASVLINAWGVYWGVVKGW
jgi:hypothetical protein